jgi:hypothetical protein
MPVRIIFFIVVSLLLLSSLETSRHLLPNGDFRVITTARQIRHLLVRAERENARLRAVVTNQAHTSCVTSNLPCLVPPHSTAVAAVSGDFDRALYLKPPACQSCSVLNL